MNSLKNYYAGSVQRPCFYVRLIALAFMVSFAVSPSHAQSLTEVTPQNTDRLQWIGLEEALDTLDLQSKGYYFLNRMTLLDEHSLAFLDFRRESVIAFDLSTGLHQAFGEEWIYPLGEGTHQVGNLFDIQPSSRGLFLTDVVNRRIIEWTTKGEWDRNIELDRVTPSRLATCQNGSFFVLLENHHRKGLFAFVDDQAKVKAHFQQIPRFSQSSIFHRDGAVLCTNNRLFFGAYYFDYLRSYESDGTLRWSRDLVGFEQNEKLLVQGENDLGRYFTINPKAKRSIGNIQEFDNTLWISFSGRTDGLMTRVDLYNTETGDYIQSIRMDEHFSEFVVGSMGLMLHYLDEDSESTHVVRYPLPPTNQYGESVLGKTSSNP
ncbi:MAG: hypothetical protein RI519_02350 [Balneolaceae bacterium]|nr:hypothetical protein [Balneolaceae bacterium]